MLIVIALLLFVLVLATEVGRALVVVLLQLTLGVAAIWAALVLRGGGR